MSNIILELLARYFPLWDSVRICTTNAVKSGLDEHLGDNAYAGNYSLHREDEWYTLILYTMQEYTIL